MSLGPLRAALAMGLLALGCAELQPRFPLEVSQSFAREPMRKLETEHVELYYPAPRQKQAYAVAERLEGCFELLSKLPLSKTPRPKAAVFMSSTDFNNAFVYFPLLGTPEQMVLPTHMSLEMFNLLELGITAIGDVSCHEAVHYVQMQQTDGLWGVANAVLGDYMAPNAFLESWFAEGLATYYEARLGRAVGRPESPLWRGMFESGVASRGGRLQGGDLNPASRELLPFGGQYVVGSFFIDYLVRTYGEERLWMLIDDQGRSIFSPLWVSLRFAAVYGKTEGELLEEFSGELQSELQLRKRPPTQRVLANDVGYFARLASSRSDGALAVVTARRDQVLQLEVREADGRLRFSRGLTPLVPGRPFVSAHPLDVSGMSFTGDGKSLFFVVADVSFDGATQTKLVRLDARTGDVQRTWTGFVGIGGDVAADGKSYVLVEISDERSNLVRIDLDTERREPLTRYEDQETLGAPAISPDGRRVAFARQMAGGFEIFVRNADDSVTRLTTDEQFDYAPRWIDDDRILFLREEDGRAQAAIFRLSDDTIQPVTDAPYAVLDPVVAAGGKQVAFLNREAWSWTLDAVPLPTSEIPLTGIGGSGEQPAQESEAASEPEVVLGDEPYNGIDGLFRPNFRVPWIQPVLILPQTGAPQWGISFGASIKGSDRLGLHNYALNASYDTLLRAPSISAGYGTSLLAPWWLQLTGFYNSQVAQTFVGSAFEDQVFEAAGVSISGQRTFWTTPLSLSFDAAYRGDGPTSVSAPSRLFVVGPSIASSYFAAESTPYGGTRSGFGVSGSAAGYPAFLGSSVSMADLSAQLTAFVPLPFTSLHTLRLIARGRMLPGAPANLLLVGGLGLGVGFLAPDVAPTAQAPISLPGLSFVEPVRGFEDHGYRGTRSLTGGARYRFTFPIDFGFTSFFYLLPSFFIRQVDLEAFGSTAWINDGQGLHSAVGGALFLRTLFFGSFPVSVGYQYAHRLGALPPAHFIGVVFE